MKLSTRLAIIVISSMLGLLIVGGISLQSLRAGLMAERQAQIATFLRLAQSAVQSYYKQEQEGKMTQAEAQKHAAEALMAFQSKNDYLVVRDENDVLVAHANSFRERLGKVDKGAKQPDGKTTVELYRAVMARDGDPGFVNIMTAKPGGDPKTLEPKLNGVTRFEPWRWMIATGVFTDDIQATYMYYMWLIGSIGLLILIATATLTILFSRQIYSRLGGEPEYAARMVEAVAQGDLTQSLKHAEDDSLLGALGHMQRSMRELIAHIQADSGVLASTAAEINTTMEEAATAAQQSADATSATAVSVEQMTVSVGMIASSAHESEEHSNRATELAHGGAQQVGEAVEEIQSVSQKIEGASTQIGTLAERTKQIGNIANVIQDIAEQTNMLALNAAIEAARAGEQGRGFAVVADEVRKLAERTSKATAEINQTIQAVQRETTEVVTSIRALVPQVARGAQLAQSAADSLSEINHSTEATLHKIRDVAHATAEQNSASTSIAGNIERIAIMAEQSERSVRNVGESVSALNKMARNMDSALSKFRLS
ncbi:methyl-accepting chemotaxis protein [Uliginosibacterium gangwonense]|uniref:methyl-accepting chemotaxis protein n=1 Tax=Uliginosibacterium gangwonense TaxID=392736 RepID=UPI00037E233E|nr:methyl-accepting chemotaxis protein [Uliginosibacterium gangwonense]